MVYCCVPFCHSDAKKTADVSFHEFPSNLPLREKWLTAIARKDFVPNSNSPSSVVCSRHFKEHEFMTGVKRRRLKPGVVPSIFNDCFPSLVPALADSAMTTRKRSRKNTPRRLVLTDAIETQSESQNNVQISESAPARERKTLKPRALPSVSNCCPSDDVVPVTCVPKIKFKRPAVPPKTVAPRNRKLRLNPDKGVQTDITATPEGRAPANDVHMSEDAPFPIVDIKGGLKEHNCQTHENRPGSQKDAQVQTNDIFAKQILLEKKANSLRVSMYRKNKLLQKLQSEVVEIKLELDKFRNNEYHQQVAKLLGKGDRASNFILQQIANSGKRRPRWPHNVIKEFVMLNHVSPKAFRHIRTRGFLMMPNRTTLKRYTAGIDTGCAVDLMSEEMTEGIYEEVKARNTSEQFASSAVVCDTH